MRAVTGTRASDADVDAALARRIVEYRDREAFDALYGRHVEAVYGIARRVLIDSALAEDMVQEVFLGFWASPERFDPSRGSVRTWLLMLVHRRSVDAVRRAVVRRTVNLADDVGTPAEDAQDAALRRADADSVRHALAALPADQRHALLLAYWGGHTQAEIADLTGVPIGTVKSRVYAGFRRLRTQLQTAGDGAPRGEA